MLIEKMWNLNQFTKGSEGEPKRTKMIQEEECEEKQEKR